MQPPRSIIVNNGLYSLLVLVAGDEGNHVRVQLEPGGAIVWQQGSSGSFSLTVTCSSRLASLMMRQVREYAWLVNGVLPGRYD